MTPVDEMDVCIKCDTDLFHDEVYEKIEGKMCESCANSLEMSLYVPLGEYDSSHPQER